MVLAGNHPALGESAFILVLTENAARRDRLGGKNTGEQVAANSRGERSKGKDHVEKQRRMGRTETETEVGESEKGE